jgi:citrate synthase
VRHHTYVHTNVTQFLDGFRHDAHPMGMLLGAVAALSTFYPDAKEIGDEESRRLQRVRLIAKFPTIAAWVFRHSRGLPVRLPTQRPRLHRQLRQHDVRDRRRARAESRAAAGARDPPRPPRRPRAERLDERGAWASARRRSIRSRPSPPGVAALYGPLHGGANEQVLRMLDEIGDVKNVPPSSRE